MITIKNLKVHEGLSEETLAMTCKVLWNGRLLGVARNEGRGGMTWLDVQAHQVEAHEQAAAFARTQPFLNLDGSHLVIDGAEQFHSLDSLIDSIAEEEHGLKKVRSWLKRHMKTKTVFIQGYEVSTYSLAHTPAVEAHVKTKYPASVVLNSLPIEEAVELFRKAETDREVARRAKRAE